MQLESPAFPAGGEIPVRYTRDSQNVSPPLEWSEVPEAARELAVVFECTTPSTREPHAQWLVYKLPPEAQGLAEGYQHKSHPESPGEITHGTNDDGNVGYDGPLGTTTQDYQYRFVLYALDSQIDAKPGLNKQQLMEKIDGHVIETAELPAHYQRPRG